MSNKATKNAAGNWQPSPEQNRTGVNNYRIRAKWSYNIMKQLAKDAGYKPREFDEFMQDFDNGIYKVVIKGWAA